MSQPLLVQTKTFDRHADEALTIVAEIGQRTGADWDVQRSERRRVMRNQLIVMCGGSFAAGAVTLGMIVLLVMPR